MVAVADVDYEIVKVGKKHADEILDFMLGDFLENEPLNKAVGLKVEEAKDFFKEIVDAGLSCSANYAVRNLEGKIVALRYACIVKRNDSANDYTFESSSNYWKVNEIQRLLNTVEKKIWELVPSEIDCLFSWLIISVDNSYTRRGLGNKLLNYKLEELKEIGCQGMITTASAYNSQQLFKKIGYEELYSIELADWKDEKGQQIFKCLDQTSKISLIMKLF